MAASQTPAAEGMDMPGYVSLYGHVAVRGAPDDAAIAALVPTLGSQGNVPTQTMRAFGEDELAQVVRRLP